MRYLRWRVTTVALDVSSLVLGVLAGRRFGVWRGGDERRETARGSARPGSEGLVLVPNWGLPR